MKKGARIIKPSTVVKEQQNLIQSGKEKIKQLRPTTALLMLLVVLFGGAALFFYFQLNELKKNPQELARQEAKNLVAEVSQLVVLPEGEIPTVATVTDPALLAGQPFFNQAKKGDKVLIYANAKKAFLYDPVAKRIVDVAPITLDQIGEPPSLEVSGE